MSYNNKQLEELEKMDEEMRKGERS